MEDAAHLGVELSLCAIHSWLQPTIIVALNPIIVIQVCCVVFVCAILGITGRKV